MFQRILVPLDGSRHGESVLPVAAHLARAARASLLLLRATPGLGDSLWQSEGLLMNASAIDEREQTEAVHYLRRLATTEELKGLEVSVEVVKDQPAQAILAAISFQETDLIVLSSHGEAGLERWTQGSVSRKIVRHSSVPVLLLRPQEQSSVQLFQKDTQPLRILVPLDGSALAEHALAPALLLAHAFSSSRPVALHLVSVLPFLASEAVDVQRDGRIQQAHAYLASVEERLIQSEAFPGLTMSSSVLLNRDSAQALVDFAESGKGMEPANTLPPCDMITISTHGRSGLAHWMFGSVTERVIAATRLPLLIVRPQEIHEKRPASTKAEQRTTETSQAGLL